MKERKEGKEDTERQQNSCLIIFMHSIFKICDDVQLMEFKQASV